MPAFQKIHFSHCFIFSFIIISAMHSSDRGLPYDRENDGSAHFQSRPTVINADLIVFHEKGSHTNVHMPPAWRPDLSFGANVLRTTQEGISQGYKQSISTLVSHCIVQSFYKLYALIKGPSDEDLAQQRSVQQKEMGNLLLLLRNNGQLIQECEAMKCSGEECELQKQKLRESLAREQQELLAALAQKTKDN